jgi:hypothetical protein
LDTLLTAARILRDKLIGCLLEFGYFNRSKFTTLGAFLERLNPFLEALPADFPVAVEVRN